MKNFDFTPIVNPTGLSLVSNENKNTQTLEEIKMELDQTLVGNAGKNENGEKEVLETMAQLEKEIAQEQTSVAHLAIKKTYGESLAKMITASNYNAEMGENETHYLIHAPYIRVVRSDVENILGQKLTNTAWRMIFARRQGESKTFNDYEFAIGNPLQTTDEQTSKEDTMQVNARFPISLKEEMDEYKDMLGLSINAFVLTAVTEFIKSLKQEI